jgi:hypothetical protein
MPVTPRQGDHSSPDDAASGIVVAITGPPAPRARTAAGTYASREATTDGSVAVARRDS